MKELTKCQSEVLKYIKEYIKNNGYAPTIRDICIGLDKKSTATIYSHLKALKKKGYISMDENKMRSIKIIGNSKIDKYKEKITTLNKQYIYTNENGIVDCKDEEAYHSLFDKVLTDLLDELGYKEITKLYYNASEFFWYS